MTLEHFKKIYIEGYYSKLLYIEGDWVIYKTRNHPHLLHLPCGSHFRYLNHSRCNDDPSPYIMKLYKLMLFTNEIM